MAKIDLCKWCFKHLQATVCQEWMNLNDLTTLTFQQSVHLDGNKGFDSLGFPSPRPSSFRESSNAPRCSKKFNLFNHLDSPCIILYFHPVSGGKINMSRDNVTKGDMLQNRRPKTTDTAKFTLRAPKPKLSSQGDKGEMPWNAESYCRILSFEGTTAQWGIAIVCNWNSATWHFRQLAIDASILAPLSSLPKRRSGCQIHHNPSLSNISRFHPSN